MKLLVVLCLALSVAAEHTIFRDYHVEIGIPAMARIQAAEAASDFDGSRIIGGQNTALGAHPHFAGLSIATNRGTSMCGASLITQNRATTAAHCWSTDNTQAFSFTVIVGTVNFFFGGVRITTTDVVTHPGFNATNANNDVAVVRFSNLVLNDNVQPISLAVGFNTFVGYIATAVGYGRTSNFGATSSTAREVDMQIIDNLTCARFYIDGIIVETTICTASGSRTTCNGDSGGPLSIGSGNDRQLIGITSFGSNAGCTAAPAGFARVSSFASWIRAQ